LPNNNSRFRDRDGPACFPKGKTLKLKVSEKTGVTVTPVFYLTIIPDNLQ